MRRRSIQRAALAFALAAPGVARAADPPPIIDKNPSLAPGEFAP